MKTRLAFVLTALGLLLVGHPTIATTVGEVAPDFEITTQSGEVFRLSDFRGKKPVYVVFWNTWCPYCVAKTRRYSKLQEHFGDKIEFIAINTTWSDSLEDLQTFQEHHHVKYATAFDTGEAVTDRYRVYNVPTEFIIDINGVVRYRDGVPEYVAAHLPDWLLPFVPSQGMASLACTP